MRVSLIALTLACLSFAPVAPAAAQTAGSTGVSAKKPRPPASPQSPDSPKPPDPAAVEQRLSAAVKKAPDDFAAQHALAEFYLHHGRIAAAIPHLERARAIDPAHGANNYDLAVAYLQTGRRQDARQHVQNLLRGQEGAASALSYEQFQARSQTLTPEQKQSAGELYNLLGEVEAHAGDRVAAADAYQRAAHLDATEDHLFDWGDNLLQLRAFEPAAQVFTAAVKRHPDAARLHVGLGIAAYSRGQYDDAVRAFCRAADLAPDDPRPYQFLGEMYGVSPELAGEVTTRLARFVRAQPKNALAHYYYAMNLWKGGGTVEPAEVERLLRRSIALDAKQPKAFLQLGILLSDERRFPEAIRELRRAVALEPTLAQGHFRLGQAYQRTGQADLAARAFARFQELDEKQSPSPPRPPSPPW